MFMSLANRKIREDWALSKKSVASGSQAKSLRVEHGAHLSCHAF